MERECLKKGVETVWKANQIARKCPLNLVTESHYLRRADPLGKQGCNSD